MPDNESASIDKVMEAAWNETMGEALAEVPDEMHHLGVPSDPVKEQEENTGAEEQPTGEPQTTTEEGTQVTESAEAPKHWSETDRQMFGKLDKEGRDFLLRRHREMEADYTRKTQEHSETVKVGRQVSQYLDSGIRQDLQAAGMSDEQFIGSLLQYHRLSVANPEQFLRITAENLGVDPAKVFGLQQNAPAPANPADPVATRLSAVEQRLKREDEQRLQKMQQEAGSSVAEFSSAKDSSGNPLHPHFEKVRTIMGRLMMADPTLDLQQAYEVAVYRDPELRKEVVAQPAAPAAAPKIDDRKVKEAEAALAAKRSNIRSKAAVDPETNKTGGAKVSLRDAISSAADEVGFVR